MSSRQPLKIFCSYSHRDEDALTELRNHLSGLRRQGLIKDWHDRQIPPGGDWDDTIKQNLEAADLILLLVSSDFIKSDYCMDLETAQALEREQGGTATVMPIFWRKCSVSGLSFEYLQGVPSDMRWIKLQGDPDSGWTEVVDAIHRVAQTPSHQSLCSKSNGNKASAAAHHCLAPKKRKYRFKPLLLLSSGVLIAAATGYLWQPSTQSQPLQAAESLLQQGEYQAAQHLCEKAPESSAKAKTRCLRIVNLMLEKHNVEQFYAAAGSEPDKAYALTIMGEAKAAQEDYHNATKHYKKAIQLNPDIAQAYFGIGQILHQDGRVREALAWYESAVERAPQNRRYLHNLAATFVEDNQLALAEEKYRALLKRDDSQLLAYAELIEVLQRQGKVAEAQQLAEQAKQGLAANPGWKDKPLNTQTWFILQEGKASYLDSWDTKQAWLAQVFSID